MLAAILVDQPWRRGCAEVRWVAEHLERRCRSLPEAELVALVRFSGLPVPDVNPALRDDDGTKVIPDLWFAASRQVVEYEGSHHQEDRDQYNADIDRYLIFRNMQVPYLQITKERMHRPELAMICRSTGLFESLGTTDPSPSSAARRPPCFVRFVTSYAAVVPPSRTHSPLCGSRVTETSGTPMSRILASRPCSAAWSPTRPRRSAAPSGSWVSVRPSNQVARLWSR